MSAIRNDYKEPIVKMGNERVLIDRRIIGLIAIAFGAIILIRPDVLPILVGVYLIIVGLFEFAR
jgi:uncharacterized membrane protein HdeD (DUF308 family)